MPDGQILDRFVAHHDEAALQDLVPRHGPKVLRQCERSLTRGMTPSTPSRSLSYCFCEGLPRLNRLSYWATGCAGSLAASQFGSRAVPCGAVRGSSSRYYPSLFHRAGPGTNIGSRFMRNRVGYRRTIDRSCCTTGKTKPTKRPPAPWSGRSGRSSSGWCEGVMVLRGHLDNRDLPLI